MADDQSDVLTLTAEIVAAYVGNASHVNANDIPAIIKSIRAALSEGDAPEAATASGLAQPLGKREVNKSITPDALISFIDNKPYKTLKRHLSRHGHDMKSYREAYGLPNDYPSVAPSYSAARSEMAKRLGLGNQRRGRAEAAPAETKPAPAKRGRKAAITAE